MLKKITSCFEAQRTVSRSELVRSFDSNNRNKPNAEAVGNLFEVLVAGGLVRYAPARSDRAKSIVEQIDTAATQRLARVLTLLENI